MRAWCRGWCALAVLGVLAVGGCAAPTSTADARPDATEVPTIDAQPAISSGSFVLDPFATHWPLLGGLDAFTQDRSPDPTAVVLRGSTDASGACPVPAAGDCYDLELSFPANLDLDAHICSESFVRFTIESAGVVYSADPTGNCFFSFDSFGATGQLVEVSALAGTLVDPVNPGNVLMVSDGMLAIARSADR